MEWYKGNEWMCESKGLCKKVLDITFTTLDKPHEVSKVAIDVEEVKNLNGRPSKYLADADKYGQEQLMEMGTALTPVDFYLELLVRQMIVGERSQCSIRTKQPDEVISFIVTLRKINETKEIFKLSVREMYDLALRYKENGVAIFKEYPSFAHEYFAHAAKCLISFKPFKNLTKARDGVDYQDMRTLFQQIRTNLAASLLNAKRYEDVIYVTKFVEKQTEPNEKCLYRRAMAYFHMKEYELTLKLIERVPNFQEKRDFMLLHQRTKDNWKTSETNYKDLVKRMFSS